MDFSVNIDQAAIEQIERNLDTLVADSLGKSAMDAIGAQAVSMILLRTQRGKFLEGSKTPAAYSKSYARKRRKKGLPTDRVTLLFGEGDLLESLRSRADISEQRITLDIGYMEGLSEEKAIEIAGYLDREGAGKNHVKYHFIGFTDKEENKLIASLRGRIAKAIEQKFGRS